MEINLLVALFAGALSFLSPCVLPLVPGYIATVTQTSLDDLETQEINWRQVLLPSLLFVISFSVIFICLGLGAQLLGGVLLINLTLLEKISGVFISLMGLFFLLSPQITKLNYEWHWQGLSRKAHKSGPVLIGVSFAFAWTPCVGPTLTAILATAALSDTATQGAFLLAVYSAGLAIPFLLTSIFFTKMTRAFSFFKRHYVLLMSLGGIMLIVMGVLIFTGQLFQLNIKAQELLDGIGINFFNEI